MNAVDAETSRPVIETYTLTVVVESDRNDKRRPSREYLSQMLRDHVDKGDLVNVAVIAMTLHHRGEDIAPAPSQSRIAEEVARLNETISDPQGQARRSGENAMTTMIERVARAICAADNTAPDPDAPILIGMRSAKAWEGRVEMARAAIEAMRESLSDEMRQAAFMAAFKLAGATHDEAEVLTLRRMTNPDQATQDQVTWKAAFDAALKEG